MKKSNKNFFTRLSRRSNLGAMAFLLVSFFGSGAFGQELFISEYLEGGSLNKAIEIYNPTSSAVSLADYQLKLSSNGAAWGTTLSLPRTLGPGQVYVVANSGANNTIKAQADTLHGVCNYNGDDPVGLFKGGQLIDIVGMVPPTTQVLFNVAGVTGAGANRTLVRKQGITQGTTDWTTSAGTNADDSQWIVYPQDDTRMLGAHGLVAPTALAATELTATGGRATWTKPIGAFGTDWDGVMLLVANGPLTPNFATVGLDAIDYTANTEYGQGTEIADAGTSGNVAYCVALQATDANGDITISGLQENTSYTLMAVGYKVVEGDNNDDEWSNPPAMADFSTSALVDLTAPVFATDFPAVDHLNYQGFDLQVQLNEPSTVFYHLQASGEAAPTVEQIIANGSSFEVPQAGQPFFAQHFGLMPSTAYDLYVVAQDMAATPNVQAAATQLSVNTTLTPAFGADFEAGTFDGWIPVNAAGIKVWLNKSGTGADGSTKWAEANGHEGSNPEVDWLISPPIALGDKSTQTHLNFWTWWRYGAEDENNFLKLFYTTNMVGNSPADEEVVWTELSFDKTGAQQVWNEIAVDITSIAGANVQFGFQYLSTNSPRSWRVDQIDTMTVAEDLTAPVFATDFPAVDHVNYQGFDLQVQIDEPSTVFYHLQASGEAAPTVEQIIANGSSFEVPQAGQPFFAQHFGLMPSTAYDLYVVAQDMAATPNVQAAATQLSVNTTLTPAFGADFEAGTFDGWIPVNAAGIKVWLNKSGTGADGSTKWAEANGHEGSNPEVDWLISPPIALGDKSTQTHLNFWTWWRYGAEDENNFLKLFYTTNMVGNSPADEEVVWTELSFDKTGAQQVWNEIAVDITSIAGANVQFGFQYLSTNSPRSWRVDQIDTMTIFPDLTAPAFVNETPKVTNLGATAFDVAVQLDEPATVYYQLLADGATAPTPAELMTNGTSLDAADPATEYAITFNSEIAASTSYDIYFVAKDAAENAQASVTLLEVTTTSSDLVAPAFVNSTPTATELSHTSFTATVALDERGAAFVHVQPAGQVAPTSAQVVANGVQIEVAEANMDYTRRIGGLSPETAYEVFFVAQDDEAMPNLQAAPTQIDITTNAAPAGDLFLSEYVEGSNSNKAIEIFNPTTEAIDMAGYVVKRASNGADWGGTGGSELALEGFLASGEVYVIANGSAIPEVLALADITNAVCNYNGNDAIGLFKNDVLIDVFGIPTSEVNFDVAGVTGAGAEHTIVRKAHITLGNTDWAASAGTNAENSEWIVYDQNVFTYLGSHDSQVVEDLEAPVFTTGPAAANVGGSSFEVEFAIDEAGTVYYHLVADGATAPTVAELMSQGQSVSAAAATLVSVVFNDAITPETSYDIYFVAADDEAMPNVQDAATLVEVTTTAADMDAPAFTGGTPSIDMITFNSFHLNLQMDEAGTAYYMVMADGAAAPSVEDLMANGTSVAIAQAETSVATLVEGLDPETAYDVYVVAADDEATPNVQATATLVEATTLAEPIMTIYDIQYTEEASGASPYVDQNVITMGIVVAKNSSGYYLQDGSGPWNGIYVYDNVNAVTLGDEVKVAAKVVEYFDWTELTTVTSFELLSSGNALPAAAQVATGEVDESYESVLVIVEEAICNTLPNQYGEWIINDGSGDIKVDDVMFPYTPTINYIYQVTGVVTFSFGEFKLLPRGADDIIGRAPVSVDGAQLDQVAVYPNPAVEFVVLENLQNVASLELISITGQVMARQSVSVERMQLDLSQTPAGVYLLRLNGTDGANRVVRLVKR